MPGTAGLIHDALLYGADDEFVAALVPFVRDGFARGDAVAVAVTRPNIALLRDALGRDAAAVTFIDRDVWYQRPATTIAGWRQVLADANARGHRGVRIVGEVAFGVADGQRPDGDGHATWTRYEAVINSVFAAAPARIVCPYDTRVLPSHVLADARRTHPVLADPYRRDSDAYLAPETFLELVPEPVPDVAGPPALELGIDRNVAAVRHRIVDAASAGRWLSPDRLTDLALVVTEIAGNSLRHGAGRRALRLWAPPWGVLCEVTDEGTGPADPLVGYRPPDDNYPDDGRGLWIAGQLSDGLAVEHAGGCTRVRFAIRSTPGPAAGDCTLAG